MRQFFKAFTMVALLIAPFFAQAEVEEFECDTNPLLHASSLECVSCGLQKHNLDKGVSKKVSEKWLVLLGMQAKKEYGYKPVISDYDKENYQKAVIRMVQVYGYCSEYLGKDTRKAGRSENYKDLSADDWKYFNEFINRRETPNKEQWQKAAAKFGFKTGVFNGFFSDKAAEQNLNYLFEGMFSKENLTVEAKREMFREKLRETLKPEYDIAGNRLEKRPDFVAAGDDDQGLRKCLEDIDNRILKTAPSDKETYGLCETVAKTCGLERTQRSSDDFCVHTGMALWPAPKSKTVNQPQPLSPPPPRPGSSQPGTR